MTLEELAQRVSGKVIGNGALEIARISAVGDAGPDAMTFATDERYFAEALASKAGAVLADEPLLAGRNDFPKPVLLVPSARLALTVLLKLFERPRPTGPFRHDTAVVDASATIGEGVYIGAHTCIGAGATIGARTVLQAGAIVGADTRVGDDCLLNQHATVLEGCVLGNRVIIHSGAVVGSEGFGWAFVEGRLEKIPQVGNVVLGDEVEIGANSTVDRAQTGSTRIGRGTKIDNLVQIGHNCEIGEHCAIAALTGLAGTTIIGDYVQVAGQVGFKGHVKVGSRVIIHGKAGIWGDVPDDTIVAGNPARPQKEEMRREVMVRKLPKLFARVDALERKPGNAGDPDV